MIFYRSALHIRQFFFAQCSGDIFFQKVMLRFKMPQDIYPCSAEKLRRAKSRSWSRWNKSTISIRRLFELFGLMRYACTIWETITTESERGDKSSCKTCCCSAQRLVGSVGWLLVGDATLPIDAAAESGVVITYIVISQTQNSYSKLDSSYLN